MALGVNSLTLKQTFRLILRFPPVSCRIFINPSRRDGHCTYQRPQSRER